VTSCKRRSKPTELPSGPEVASRTYQRLAHLLLAIPTCDEHDLTSDLTHSDGRGVRRCA
jgi:hypothetical protein